MITMEEIYQKITSSEELKSRYAGIMDIEALKNFLEELGCQEAPDKFLEYVKEKCDGELSDVEAGSVEGGIQAGTVVVREYHDVIRPVIDQKFYL